MTTRTWALAALLVLGAACARPGEESDVATRDRTAAPEPPVSVAQATAGKPLIHVWKSPT